MNYIMISFTVHTLIQIFFLKYCNAKFHVDNRNSEHFQLLTTINTPPVLTLINKTPQA